MTIRNILIIDDNVHDRELLKRLLREDCDHEYAFVEASDIDAGLKHFHAQPPDCVLLDSLLPGADGLVLLGGLVDAAAQTSGVLMLTGTGDEMLGMAAVKHGADDYLAKRGLTAKILIGAVNAAKERAAARAREYERQAALTRQAVTDPTTGLYNRRYFVDRLVEEAERALRHALPTVIVLLNLDKLDVVRESFGASACDATARRVATLLFECVRTGDIVARLDDENFALLLPHTSLSAATVAIDRLLRMVRELEHPITVGQSQSFHVTCSIGLACFNTDTSNPSTTSSHRELLRQARWAQHEASARGGNQVRVWQDDAVSAPTADSDVSQPTRKLH